MDYLHCSGNPRQRIFRMQFIGEEHRFLVLSEATEQCPLPVGEGLQSVQAVQCPRAKAKTKPGCCLSRRSPAFPVQILPLQCLSEGKSEDPRALCPSHALRQQPVPRPQVQALQSRLGSCCWEFGGAGGCQGRELGRAVRGGQQGPGVTPRGSSLVLL